MAPTINTTKPVATPIATFVSIDNSIIFPFNHGDDPVAPVFWILFRSLRISARSWMPGTEEEKSMNYEGRRKNQRKVGIKKEKLRRVFFGSLQDRYENRCQFSAFLPHISQFLWCQQICFGEKIKPVPRLLQFTQRVAGFRDKLIRSSPESLSATLAALPSMSLAPLAPFSLAASAVGFAIIRSHGCS
jgi:hypothetical protein